MRIIAGKYARRKLQSPKWQGVRPLLSRLRQPLFDTLMPFLTRGPFLDLYGGTGAFSLEALSRGAPEATLIELDPRSAKLIGQNAKTLDVAEPFEILQGDALAWIPKLAARDKQYAVIAAAPPYYEGLEDATLDLLDEYKQLLQPDGLMFVQYPSEAPPKLARGYYEEWKTRKYGNTTFTYYMHPEED